MVSFFGQMSIYFGQINEVVSQVAAQPNDNFTAAQLDEVVAEMTIEPRIFSGSFIECLFILKWHGKQKDSIRKKNLLLFQDISIVSVFGLRTEGSYEFTSNSIVVSNVLAHFVHVSYWLLQTIDDLPLNYWKTNQVVVWLFRWIMACIITLKHVRRSPAIHP